MIRDAFDWVYAAAEQEGIVCQTADVPFTLQAVRDAFAAGILGMAELFRGGGNLTVCTATGKRICGSTAVSAALCWKMPPA